MQLFENISLAIAGLRANKMRALLTMLGIIIGIGSVITIMTVGSAMSASVMQVFNDMGAKTFQINISDKPDENGNTNWQRSFEDSDMITNEMLAIYQERFADRVEGLMLSVTVGSGQVQNGRNQANVNVAGVSPRYLEFQNINIVAGHDINEREVKSGKHVAVISDSFVKKLFPNTTAQEAIGKEIKVRLAIGTYTFTISGVYKYEVSGPMAGMVGDTTTALTIPVTTAIKLTNADDSYYSLQIKAKSTVANMQAFTDQTRDFFNNTFYRDNKYVQINAQSMDSMIGQMTQVMSMMQMVVSIIAAISLLVGGIGVMNIMLVSVTERTREIGTRKALGAKSSAIRVQFIVESIIICLIGGIIGVMLGTALGRIGSLILKTPAWPNLAIVLIAVCFSMAIGVFFGYYPANKAAKLDPIEALRYE